MKKAYEILGAAFGLAAQYPETAFGPAGIRSAGLMQRLSQLGVEVTDGGDIRIKGAAAEIGDPKQKYLAQILEFGELFRKRVTQSYDSGKFPVILGGDHSTSIFSISAGVDYIKRTKGKDARVGLLWIDAHPDILDPSTTISGNVHGMSTAVLLGRGNSKLTNLYGFAPKMKVEDIAYVGLRDVDPPEKIIIREIGATAYSMTEIDYHGMGQVLKSALEKVSKNTDAFIVSMDLDACDPTFAPGVGSPVRGGLTYREAHLALELAARTPGMISFELLEYNPARDREQETAKLAISFIESALGKSIL